MTSKVAIIIVALFFVKCLGTRPGDKVIVTPEYSNNILLPVSRPVNLTSDTSQKDI